MENNIKNLALPSRKSVEEAIKVIEGFRDLCIHQFEFGYWATADFPSKHHINKILQLNYRDRVQLNEFYGEGLVRHIYQILPVCKSYLNFVRGTNERLESKHK